ncbi:GHKL domain-containing protein [Anaerobacillus sp. HL2]|nr:GHKL domain-containing protein [Anaerobacillus sp. HL2]
MFTKMNAFRKEEVPFETNNITSRSIAEVISSTDLIRLVSNLLDNAYEATIELPKKHKKLFFRCLEDDQYHHLIVKNSSQYKRDYTTNV